MSRPRIATRDEWLVARRELLAAEKEFTRQWDALSAARRALPMVEVTKEYVFASRAGPKTLAELFGGHRPEHPPARRRPGLPHLLDLRARP
jgi:predicted dithiol-disulfide oxidoreductase (DUF899 family)